MIISEKWYLLTVLSVISVSSAVAQTAVFRYEFAGIMGKSGSFTFTDSNGKQVFDAPASAGYLGAANNPYIQATKNIGPIPSGTWYISAIKNEKKSILRLQPGPDVLITQRNGFLIHGTGDDKTAEQSSNGCIILAPEHRSKLKEAFKQHGKFQIRVVAVVDDSRG